LAAQLLVFGKMSNNGWYDHISIEGFLHMSNGRIKLYFLIAINLIVINTLFIANLLQTWPYLGHDYSYFIPRLLDTHLFILKNGLAIQWYTPSFGGGLPAYPNPQHLQFSLVQLLLFITNPVNAIVISTVIFVGVGFVACYCLLSHVFSLDMTSSLLGSVFFSANGFILERVAVGHLGYQTFPLLAVLIWIVLDKSITKKTAAVWLGLIVSLMINQAGFYLLVSVGFSSLITIALGYLYKPALIDFKRVVLIFLSGGLIAILLSASKLAAIYAFMQFFPRKFSTEYDTTFLLGLMGIFLQLLGTMNLVPLAWIAGLDPANLPANMTGVSHALYGYWEFDMSVSPVVFLILLIGVDNLLHRFRRAPRRFLAEKRWIAWLLLAASIWLTIEFILGKGLIYPFLQSLPILNSLHVRVRFTSAFLFPVAFLASAFYDSWVKNWPQSKALIIFGFVNLFAILPLLTYFVSPILEAQSRLYDTSYSYNIYQVIQTGAANPVSTISQSNDTLVLLNGTSNLRPYEPIFGYNLENFHPEVIPGSIWKEREGFYNLTNPSGYVFPNENNTRSFERIRVGDEENLGAFVRHESTHWKIAIYQQVLNLVSGLTLILAILFLIWDSNAVRKLSGPLRR
jgi:hypothetical protein